MLNNLSKHPIHIKIKNILHVYNIHEEFKVEIDSYNHSISDINSNICMLTLPNGLERNPLNGKPIEDLNIETVLKRLDECKSMFHNINRKNGNSRFLLKDGSELKGEIERNLYLKERFDILYDVLITIDRSNKIKKYLDE